MRGTSPTAEKHDGGRRSELLTFLFTVFLLIPGLAVGFVGAFGLAIWLIQIIYGPPGPPAA
ncbi:periplasmic nitrate reductase, NapE protein [Oceanibacterium hippocampi]|uniref:Periplasmic nitrate reductase protein NapE n=1 Tax=Oceanibacterium hippocampi TaxID=745714 RepID=A0A1Y5TF73_9PROT|nr:hypothetical protein [Oceanibacterium hippocampi]SLN62696.1 Periplasmic nitrate reductase protein NapE [Oceanibacterium hippocampi]